MKKELLSLLFASASAENGFPGKDWNLSRLYERTQCTRVLWDPIESLLQDMDAAKFNAFENTISALADAFEEQGFINGFRLGMMLREESDVSKLDIEKGA